MRMNLLRFQIFALAAAAALSIVSNVSSAAMADDAPGDVESAVKEIVKVTPKGLEPQTLKLGKLDSSVFFLNATKDSLLTLDVNFQARKAHCASSNMKFTAEGHMRSVKPVGPKDFALMCFPERGTYPVEVYGVLPNGEPLTGSIVVE